MGDARPVLVIVAHGSRADGWVQLIETFTDQVRDSPGVSDAFSAVHAAYLEHSQPALASTVRLSFEAGAGEVFVLPLFLTHSTHAAEDVPGILGLEVPAHIRQRLVAEGHEVLYPGLPISMVSLDDKEEALVSNVIARVSGSARPGFNEGIVLCAYGSTLHHEQWEQLMSRLRVRLMEEGFGYVARAYVGHSVGLSSAPTREAIEEVGSMAGIDLVHVIPLLLSQSELQYGSIAEACALVQGEGEIRLRYAADAILPDPALVSRVAATVLRMLGVYAGPVTKVLA